MKRKIPKILSIHLIQEFSFSLLIYISVIIALIIITNFVEELFYLKELGFNKNIYFYSFFYTIVKTPALLINFIPFVFLFSSIHFFVKIIKNSEFISLRISGISNLYIILTISIYVFILGLITILIFSPLSSEMMKYYEKEKKKLSGNQNLIIVNDNGVWIKDFKNDNRLNIYKAESFRQNQENIFLKNLEIYIFNANGNIDEIIIAKNAQVNNDLWDLNNVNIFKTDFNKKIFNSKYSFKTNIKISEFNNIFSNADTFSIWNIPSYLITLRTRGYYGDELVIKFHKYLSLPFLLFSTVILATVFTINQKKIYENYIYIFNAIISGMIIYFLSDLSIALGKSDKVPLVLSVWMPIIFIMILCFFSLIRSNET